MDAAIYDLLSNQLLERSRASRVPRRGKIQRPLEKLLKFVPCHEASTTEARAPQESVVVIPVFDFQGSAGCQCDSIKHHYYSLKTKETVPTLEVD
jgi:hypothetical protein